MSVKTSKWVCVACRVTGSYQYQTIGKTYDVTTDTSYGGETSYFTGDDGTEYLFFHDEDFIPLEEWRERQLNKIL